MFRRKNSGPIGTLEGELARLYRRRDELASLLQAAEDAASAAAKARATALIEVDDLSGPIPERLAAVCAEATARRDALAAALAELQTRIFDAERSLDTERDRAERATAATELEARAARIDKVASLVGERAESLAEASRAYHALVEREGIRSSVFPGVDRSAEAVAFNVVHDALASHLRVTVAHHHPDALAARSAEASSCEFMSTRMRELAAALRRGEGSLDDARPMPNAPQVKVTPPPDVEVALREAIEWIGSEGHIVRVPEGGGQLPAPVAQEAIGLGIAVPRDAPEYRSIVAEALGPDIATDAVNRRTTHIRRGPPWRRLETNLFAWLEGERQRLLREAA